MMRHFRNSFLGKALSTPGKKKASVKKFEMRIISENGELTLSKYSDLNKKKIVNLFSFSSAKTDAYYLVSVDHRKDRFELKKEEYLFNEHLLSTIKLEFKL